MARKIMIIVGGAMNILWGAAHLFPTGSVVRGFGDISVDNQRIVAMEWINEGLTLIFIGVLVSAVALIDSENSKSARAVYITAAVMLLSMAVLSLFTGFQIDFMPFRLCPAIFLASGLLIAQGAFRK